MPGFYTHRNINLITGLLASGIYYKTAILSIILFLIGVLESSYIHSPDIDKKNSIPYRNLGPLKLLYKPFTDYGHREVLHNPLWGVIVLVLPIKYIVDACMLYIPLDLTALWYGMIWAVWMHIFADWAF